MATPENDSNAQAAEAPAAEAQAANPNTVELDAPIVRGETTITHVTVRKPMSGELRGTSLAELANLDVNALRKVLPRITLPALTDVEIGRLEPADLLDLGMKVGVFLLKKSAKAEIDASLTA